MLPLADRITGRCRFTTCAMLAATRIFTVGQERRGLANSPVIVNTTNRFDRTTPYSRPGVKTGGYLLLLDRRAVQGVLRTKTFGPKGRKSAVGSEDIKPPIPKGVRPPLVLTA